MDIDSQVRVSCYMANSLHHSEWIVVHRLVQGCILGQQRWLTG